MMFLYVQVFKFRGGMNENITGVRVKDLTIILMNRSWISYLTYVINTDFSKAKIHHP